MRLGTKLIASFILVALLVLITGGLSYYLSNEIKNDLVEQSRGAADQLQVFTEMTVQLQNSLLYTRNYLIESNKRRGGDESLTTISQIRQSELTATKSLNQFGVALNSMKENDTLELTATGTEQRNLTALKDSLEESFVFYDSLIRELFDLEREGSYGDEVFNVTIEPYFRNTLLPILLQLRSSFDERVDLQLAEIQLRADVTVKRIIFFTGLAFILSIILAYLVYQSIAKPVQTLTAAAEEIGEGNLSKRIELKSKDELAHLANTFNKMAENLSQSMVSKSYVNNIIQSMGDMLMVTDLEGNIKMVNDSTIKKLKLSEKELLSQSVWKLVANENGSHLKFAIENSSKDDLLTETKLQTSDGDVIPVILTSSYLNDNLNQNQSRVFVASDITIQKEAEKKISDSLQEKNVLLAEIHHRVKNNLAVISGLLQMQIWNLDDELSIKALKDSQIRIQSIALIHEKLYKTENFASINIAEYVKELVQAIETSFSDPDKNIDVQFDLSELSMTINQAIPFSLLLNEGVVNVYKHAFKNKKEGRILISLQNEGDEIILEIEDDGVGLDKDKKVKEIQSLGLTLIDTLTQQLEGTFSISNGKNKGVLFSVKFPVMD
ncbi:MAG: histidine kinase dimerization/phosphoacceptor domain -containing protein [Balneolaceae bacterium]